MLQLVNVIIKLILLEAFLPQAEITESGYRGILELQLIYIVFAPRESLSDRIKKERGWVGPQFADRRNEESAL